MQSRTMLKCSQVLNCSQALIKVSQHLQMDCLRMQQRVLQRSYINPALMPANDPSPIQAQQRNPSI